MTAPPVDITRTDGSRDEAVHTEPVMHIARSLPEYFSRAGLETLARDVALGADVYLMYILRGGTVMRSRSRWCAMAPPALPSLHGSALLSITVVVGPAEA